MGAVHARQPDPSASMSLTPPSRTQTTTDSVTLDSISAQVTRVHVEGVGRTKEDLLVSNIKPIFDVRHFEDLVLKAQDIRNNLQDLGCFSDVDIHIDTSESGGPKDYEVTFKVKELRRMVGSINTMVGNQEGSLLTGIRMPNLMGRGERFQVDYTHGTKKTSTFNASLIKPFHGRARTTLTSSIFQQMAEFPPSGFRELNRGTLIDLSFVSAPQILHNLQWEGCWRDLRSLNRTCAFAVREQAGHSLKSSLKHILTVDRRDNLVFPSTGSMLRLTQEFAGLGGNVGFFKNEVELQANLPLVQDFVLQGTLQGGFLCPSEDKKTTIADRFFIGGPLNLRGFEMRGVGNESDGNALGGTLYWASGLHLFAPLPFRPGRGGFGDLFRTHVFVTAGNLGEFSAKKTASQNLEEVLHDFRFSYGVGLAFKLGGVARIELNYCIPVKACRGDKPAPGLQLGVGVNFL